MRDVSEIAVVPDSLSRLPGLLDQLGKEVVIEGFQGRDWTVGRWDMEVWAELLEWAKKRLPDPWAAVDRLAGKPGVSEAMLNKLIQDAYQQQKCYSIQSPEVTALVDGTVEGQVESLYLRLKSHHPAVTKTQAMDLYREVIKRGVLELVNAKTQGKLEGNGRAPAE